MRLRPLLLSVLISCCVPLAASAKECELPLNTATLTRFCKGAKGVTGKTHPDTCRYDIASPKARRTEQVEAAFSPLTSKDPARERDRLKVMAAGMLGKPPKITELPEQDGATGYIIVHVSKKEPDADRDIFAGKVQMLLMTKTHKLSLSVDSSLCAAEEAEALARYLLAAAPK